MKNTLLKDLGDDIFNKLIEGAPNALIMVDSAGRILLANRQAEILFGYSKKEYVEINIDRLISGSKNNKIPFLINRFFDSQDTRLIGVDSELFGLRVDGAAFPIEIGITPLEIKGKTYVLASIIDTTERKKADDRFRLAVEAAPNAMIMIGADGKIVMVNKQTESLFVYHRDQLIGQPIEILVPERFRHNHPHQRKGFVGNPQVRSMGAGRDLYGRKSDGGEIPIEIGLTPVGDGPGLFVLASIIDISERKKNEQLMAAKEAALEASRIKSQFLATMSHEIRTPLNGIVGLTNLLFKMDMSDIQKEHLDGIRSSTESLLSLINDILDLSKIEAGRMDLEIIDFNLSQLLSDVISVISAPAKHKGLQVKSHVDSSLPLWLKGDLAKLKQVLINLLGNSIKFTELGEIVVSIRQYQSDRFTDRVRIEVRDTGIGIPDHIKERLFEVFTQGDSSTSRKYGGTGLGLSICKKLTEIMGGTIGVDSIPGQGSCFWIELSLPEGKEIEKMARNVVHFFPMEQAKQFRVLVAEDNIINQKVALGTLKNFGIEGQVVGNGLEACEVLEKFHFDIVLMDCQMPEMDGFDATMRIRKNKNDAIRNIPIIAMTANVMQGDREHCLSVGMNDYIAKPIDQNELERILLRWLSVDSKGEKTSKSSVDRQVMSSIDALTKLRKTYNDNLVRELINTFTMTTPQILEKIEKAFQRFDFKTILMEAHTLKSTSLLLGLNDYSNLAFNLEKSCREETTDHFQIQISVLVRDFPTAISNLKSASKFLNLGV